jgi:Opioid growth factor receptor (OGFr) conserved region
MSHEKYLTAMLVPFHLGEKQDPKGRMIQDIWAWDFEDLECAHDYIQWLFPLSEKSAFNPDAPVVEQEVIQAFKVDQRLQQNLMKSFVVMLRFYGLQCDQKAGKVVVSRSEDYPIRRREWICMFNHNYLRITRILKCLITFGLEDEALAFYECLRQIYREDRDQIGGETFQYWTNAVKTEATA